CGNGSWLDRIHRDSTWSEVMSQAARESRNCGFGHSIQTASCKVKTVCVAASNIDNASALFHVTQSLLCCCKSRTHIHRNHPIKTRHCELFNRSNNERSGIIHQYI